MSRCYEPATWHVISEAIDGKEPSETVCARHLPDAAGEMTALYPGSRVILERAPLTDERCRPVP